MALSPTEQLAVDEFCRRVRARFGPRVVDLALFGSHARGEAHELSDIDVATVIDGLTGAEAREVAFVAGDMMTEHDVLIAPFVVSAEHMRKLVARERLIAAEIARDRIPL
ncbi:MAG: nucleotidyltransferase domain-containing protein [Deltaproteobacteria bacterium]|nr:nucleotidyltransferase domain-containing protein [Deltaproteobacteria bacterium]